MDFVTIARGLGRNQDEASLRAAASLAYYGAFHFAGERLEQLTTGERDQFRWTARRKSHQELPEQWAIRWGYYGYLIANSLTKAHELRKKANYDLHQTFTASDKDETFRFVARVIMTVYRAG